MKLAKNWSAIAMAAALVTVTGCADTQESRFDPRNLSAGERYSARENVNEPLKPLPTTLQSQYLPDQRDNPGIPREPAASQPLAADNQIVRLPLREITQRAVANNLAVRVAGYNPAIEETRIVEAEARFDPDFFAGATYQSNRQPGTLFTGDRSDQILLETGLRQLLPSGGQVELAYRPVRYDIADDTEFSPAAGEDTFWSSQVQLQVTQPLLRDFGFDVNRARIVINRNNQRISVLDFRRDLEEMLRNVEETYWRLVQAEDTVRIQEGFLQRTMDTADILSLRFGQDVTMEQISTSVSRVESARADLILARQRVKDLSDQLKNFMNDPDFPVSGAQLILPSSDPLLTALGFDLADSVQTALLNRYELGQQQIRVDSAAIALRVAKNNRLPQLNLVGGVGTQAIGEDAFGTGDLGGDNENYGDNVSWSLGLQFVQKLGNREALAIYRRAELQRQQAIDQYRQAIDQVTLDVKLAQRQVETSWQSIAQNRAARFAAAQALETVETIERGGEALTPNFIERKLARQQELAAAERAEADAVATYNIAISRLEFAKGTLLRFNNVLLEERPRGK